MSDATPMVAERYRLDELIGSGPMGQVWRGYDTQADWVVAVKILDAGAATREVLQRHAQAVARVIHPNVAMVLDVGEQDGSPYLVMEFLTGQSLGEELAARGPLPVVEVCDLVGQAAGGLDAAHRAGVTHGQVGPDSFRAAGSGVLKAVGFGLADQAPSPREAAYLAPERAAGGPASPAADLYALGCVCYELLTGHHPFPAPGAPSQEEPGGAAQAGVAGEAPSAGEPSGSAPAEGDAGTGGASAEGDAGTGGASGDGDGGGGTGGADRGDGPRAGGGRTAPPPSRFRPDVPADLDRLVLALLSEDPASRPASGEAVRRALAAIARPGAAPPQGPPTAAHQAPAPPPSATPPGAPSTGMSLAPSADTAVYGPGGGPGHTAAYPGGQGPRSGDTAVYGADDLEREPPAPAAPRGNRALVVQVAAAVAVILAVAIGAVLLSRGGDDDPSTPVAVPTTQEPTPPQEYTVPSTEIQVLPTTEPTPTAATTLFETPPPPKATLGDSIPPGGWSKWLAEFDNALRFQLDVGDANPQVLERARDKVRKAAGKFERGNPDEGLSRIADVYAELREGQRGGDVPTHGPLAAFLDDWQLPEG
uniref:serine/threonine-protein kinase n=1 Tax=Nonomuraea pusilla TaxID=46177 RepID=UPI0006E2DBB3|nr:serine/threonine-protein kinase [Nonomuraea pusilla]